MEKNKPDFEVHLENFDAHISDLRTMFGMCHTHEHGHNVFKCATVCADLPNCPSKIVPKGQYEARIKQIETLQSKLSEAEKRIKFLENEMLDVLDLKEGKGPTALSNVVAALDKSQSQNERLLSALKETVNKYGLFMNPSDEEHYQQLINSLEKQLS